MPKRQPHSIAQLHAALVQVTAHLPVIAAYVFGSWATDQASPQSDLDVALLLERPLAWDERQVVAAELAMNIPAANGVDLIDLTRVDSVFAAHVVTEGDLLFARDDNARQRFEMLALAKYTRLNEARAGILTDIRERGHILAD